MRTPIIRSIEFRPAALRLASIVAVLALAACEKDQSTPPTDGDAPVAEEPAGDTAADEPAEAPKAGGW